MNIFYLEHSYEVAIHDQLATTKQPRMKNYSITHVLTIRYKAVLYSDDL